MKRLSISFRECIVAFIFFTILFFLFLHLITGAIHSGFHFMDDHTFITIKQELTSSNSSFWEVLGKRLRMDFDVTRFRPVYWCLLVLQTHLMKLDFFHYALFMGVFGSLVASVLYSFGRSLQFSILEALLFVLLCLLGPQAELWWMNGNNESRGVFFMGLALLFALLSARHNGHIGYKVLFCVTMAIAAYCKESFALAIPAVMLFKIYLHRFYTNTTWYLSLRNNFIEGVLMTCVLLSVVIMVRLKNPTMNIGYAGVSEETRITDYLRTFLTFAGEDRLALIWIVQLYIIACLLFYQIDSLREFKTRLMHLAECYFPLVMIAALFIATQVFIYTKSSFIGRYYIPATIPVALLLVLPLYFVRKKLPDASRTSRATASIFLAAAVLLYLYPKAQAAYQSGRDFRVFGNEINGFLTAVVQQTPPDGAIVLVYNPIYDVETVESFRTYVNVFKSKPNPLVKLPTSQKQSLHPVRTAASVILLDHRLEPDFLKESRGEFNPDSFTRQPIGRYIFYYRKP